MTKEEARNIFGGSVVNNLLSLGAEPTNVVRQEVKKRYAHIFKDDTSPTPKVIGFYWDDYVAGVTNSA